MKCCPTCQRTYTDDTQSFCLEDGASLRLMRDAGLSDNLNPTMMSGGVAQQERRSSDEPPPTEILYPRAAHTIPSPVPVPTMPPQQPLATSSSQGNVTQPRSNTARTVAITVLATVLLLGLGAAGAWMLLSDGENEVNRNTSGGDETTRTTSSQPTPTATVSPAATVNTPPAVSQSPKPIVSPTPERTSNTTPSAKQAPAGAWFVILGSYPKADLGKAKERASYLQRLGYDARVIDTDNYPNLKSGLWAVVMGPYEKNYAQSMAGKTRSVVPEAYIKTGR